MGKLLDDMMKGPVGLYELDWPISGKTISQKIPNDVVRRNRRILCTEGEGRDLLKDLLRGLCYGVQTKDVNDDLAKVVFAQDIAKGILSMCGMVITLDGLQELELKEE